MLRSVLLLAPALVLATAENADSKVTPVQKVIELLTGMLEKGKKAKHEEQVQFAAYNQFCTDTSAAKKKAISEAEDVIELLKADIQKYGADAERLAQEIAGHQEDIATWTGDIKAATKVRKEEKADYDATRKDYSESIEALRAAIAVLAKQDHDRKQAESLVQVKELKNSNLIPAEAKKVIETFLAQDPEAALQVSAPEANAYEFQSKGIVEMLEKLLAKFVDERTTLEKEELNSQAAFDMLVQDLKGQIEAAEEDVTEKSAKKAKKLQAKADAEGDLVDTTGTMEADMKYLSDLTSTCQKKSADFESRQKLRGEEIEAIEKAIEIIESGAVAGSAEKHLPSLLQSKKKAAALAQLRTDGQSPVQMRVAQYLQDQAKQINSRVLAALAVRVADDPFRKIKKMIKDLIVKLMEEANEEANTKGFCDSELATNAQTRKEKTMTVETLHADIDGLEASIAQLTEDIAELTKAIADLDKAMSEATTIRAEEKAKNGKTIQDAAKAQDAVAKALQVLKDFYAKAAEATALLQKKQEPEIFDSEYKGMQSESGGVIGMLEVIESDFARLQSETETAESQAQKEYDEFMTDSAMDKATKQSDLDHKTAKKQDQEQELVSKKGDLEGTQKELDAALAYFEKLKPTCINEPVNYEERVTRRKEEIESLQEALKILSGEEA